MHVKRLRMQAKLAILHSLDTHIPNIRCDLIFTEKLHSTNVGFHVLVKTNNFLVKEVEVL